MGDRGAAAAAMAWKLSLRGGSCRQGFERCSWFGQNDKVIKKSVAQKDEMRCCHMLNAASYNECFYAIFRCN